MSKRGGPRGGAGTKGGSGKGGGTGKRGGGNPNWPSRTGNRSGPNRGNNPPRRS